MKMLNVLAIGLALITASCSNDDNKVGDNPFLGNFGNQNLNQTNPNLPPNNGGLIPDGEVEERNRITCRLPEVFRANQNRPKISGRGLLNSIRGEQGRANRVTVYKVIRSKSGTEVAAFHGVVDNVFSLDTKHIHVECFETLAGMEGKIPRIDASIDIPSIVHGGTGFIGQRNSRGFNFDFQFSGGFNWSFGTPGFNPNAPDHRNQRDLNRPSTRTLQMNSDGMLGNIDRGEQRGYNHRNNSFLNFFRGSHKTETTYHESDNGNGFKVITKKIGVDTKIAGEYFETDIFTAIEYLF